MVSESEAITAELQVDVDNLFLEETFTDLNVGTLRRLTPVKTDGSPDPARKVRFLGQTQILTQLGPVPIQCEIEAETLDKAVEMFPDAVKVAIERAIDEVKEIRRQQASQIVVPEMGAGTGRIQLK